MLNQFAFAHSLAVLTATLYVLFGLLALVSPRAFQLLFNAQFFGADVAALLPSCAPGSLGRRPSPLRTSRSAINSWSSSGPWADHACHAGTESLGHVLILSEAHLRRLLRAYGAYYNTTRPHQSLDNNSPQPRVIEPPACGRIIAIPRLAGSIIAISGSPDPRRVPAQPPLVRLIQHAADRVMWRSRLASLSAPCHGDHDQNRPRRQRESRSLTVRRRHEKVGPMGFLTRTGPCFMSAGSSGVRPD